MKKLTYIISASILILILGLLSCKDDEPGAVEVETNKLSQTWAITDDENTFVLLDNLDVTSNFNGFELVVKTDGTYATSGGTEPNLWPATGSWAFEKIGSIFNFNKVIREDGLILNIENIERNILRFSFQYQHGTHNGRTNGVSAEYTFNMAKK